LPNHNVDNDHQAAEWAFIGRAANQEDTSTNRRRVPSNRYTIVIIEGYYYSSS
jgi:hypothetical protein